MHFLAGNFQRILFWGLPRASFCMDGFYGLGYSAGVFLVRSFVGSFYLALFCNGEFHERFRRGFYLALFLHKFFA